MPTFRFPPMFTRTIGFSIAGLMLLFLSSCSKDDDKDKGPSVQLNSLSPTSGFPNSQVTLSGIGFNSIVAENKVTFNGKAAVVTSATVTQLIVTVPADATTGPVSLISSGQAASNQPVFTVESTVPTLLTSPVTQIKFTSAKLIGSVVKEGASGLTRKGFCWSLHTEPTLKDSYKQINLDADSFTYKIPDLLADTTYFVRTYATNLQGTSYGNEVFFTTKLPVVGETGPSGGIVFYDKGSNQNGWRFLEAAPADNAISKWGCGGNVPGTLTSIGSGNANTNAILLYCIYPTAARLCADYVLNGYDDWFMPSKDELNQMYLNLYKKKIGTWEYYEYMSSSQAAQIDSAWGQQFIAGYSFTSLGTDFNVYHSRAIRDF